jgi:hypothetical protein
MGAGGQIGYGPSKNRLRPSQMRKTLHKCARCGQPASMRIIEDVVDGYWTKIRLALCAVCDKLLIACDLRAWEWFREYTKSASRTEQG